MTDVAAAVVLAVVGLVVGAGLATVTQRAPGDEPLLAGVGVRELVPFRRWMSPGAIPRWVVLACEIATPTLFVLAALRFGFGTEVAPYLVFFAALVVVTVVDLEHYRIPDRIVFPTLALMTVLVVLASLVQGEMSRVLGALGGAVLYFVLLLVPHLISPKGMGFGDVKLALVLGLGLGWLSPKLIFLGLLAAALFGIVGGIAAMIARGRRAAFPFGPALALGAVVTVLTSEGLSDAAGF